MWMMGFTDLMLVMLSTVKGFELLSYEIPPESKVCMV